MSTRSRRRGATALLATGSVVLGLALCELLVRLLGLAPGIDRIRPTDPASPFRMSEDPILGYELKPGFHGEDGIETNSRGLRDLERPLAKAPGEKRIILLGDSVVMGLYLDRREYTIPAQLEALLPGVEVLNFGVRGYSTLPEVELLRLKGLDYRPDLVIVIFLRNDHRNQNGDISKPFVRRRPRWAERLFVASHLFRLLALRTDLYHFRAELDPNYDEHRNQAAMGTDNVASGLDLLARLAHEYGFRTLVAVWPSFLPGGIVNPHGLFEDEGETRMKVETLAARRGIPTVRLSAYFRAQYRERRAVPGFSGEDPKDYYTADGMHPTKRGAAATAAILKQILEERPELLAGSLSPAPRAPR